MPWKSISISLVTCLFLQMQGCAPAIVATGAVTGAAVVHDRRTTGTMVEDETIELKAIDLARGDSELWEQAHLNITSYNGIALLTGETPTAAMRARLERLVRGIDKVRDIHNEIAVAAPSSILSRSSDSLITSKLKTKMVVEKNFDSTRTKVITENGIVYLMGLLTREEAAKATEIARSIGGVQKVVKLFEYVN